MSLEPSLEPTEEPSEERSAAMSRVFWFMAIVVAMAVVGWLSRQAIHDWWLNHNLEPHGARLSRGKKGLIVEFGNKTTEETIQSVLATA